MLCMMFWGKCAEICTASDWISNTCADMFVFFKTRSFQKGHCMGVQCVVYKATISAPNYAEKYYYGLSEPEFKSRYANHKSSLKYPSKRNTTELSKYYWELRDKGVEKKDIKVDWNIERQAHKYKCGTRRCDLCLTDTCPHRTKYRYHKVTKVKIK